MPTDPLAKIQQLRAYYAANPAREVANVNGLSCTAAACETTYQALSDAQSASNQSNVDAGTAKAALETGLGACRNRLIGLRTELNQLLDDTDPRWLAFGFELPGAVRGPETPQNLVVTPGTTGSRSLFFDWDNARRADSYRVTLTDATGTKLVDEIVWESEYMATGLPVGAAITAAVTGHNATGESQPTAAITATVP